MEDVAEYAGKGSQRWLQVAVAEAQDMINTKIRSAMSLPPEVEITWLCPLKDKGFGEYRDEAFLELLKVDLPKRKLMTFWPKGGPMWDGLAKTSRGDILMVEAKAHIPEMVSPPTRASEKPLKQIEAALTETRNALAPKTQVSWTGIFYQYTNRLAHLYLLRTLNDTPAHLVYVYFTNANDVFGPTTEEEWRGAIKLMLSYFGLRRHKLSKYIHEVFVDVHELPSKSSASS